MNTDDDEISFLALGSVLLRWRRMVISVGLIGAAMGLTMGLIRTRMYASTAVFMPQGSSEGATSGIGLAASQFGFRVPTRGDVWSPSVYVELLESRALLERIVLDTIAIAEEGGRHVAVMDLFDTGAQTPALRIHSSVGVLRGVVEVWDDKKLGAVRLSVATRWPSVSLAIAEGLIAGVTRFNFETRKSQAAMERRFVETQAEEAERALREAEDRQQLFLQRNRTLSNSPELVFENERLMRDVTLRQQLYSSLLQNREEARIREVRDTPVITVLEDPRLPAVGEPRGLILKGALGGLLGVLAALALAVVAQALSSARRAPSDDAKEFFGLLEESVPDFLKPRVRS